MISVRDERRTHLATRSLAPQKPEDRCGRNGEFDSTKGFKVGRVRQTHLCGLIVRQPAVAPGKAYYHADDNSEIADSTKDGETSPRSGPQRTHRFIVALRVDLDWTD